MLGLTPGVLIDVAAEQVVMQYIDMVLFSEYLQIQHSIAPRGEDLTCGAVVAIGDKKGIAGRQ